MGTIFYMGVEYTEGFKHIEAVSVWLCSVGCCTLYRL